MDINSLRYNADGLIPVVVQDDASGQVLMHAWMNAEALARTLEERRMVYWSRSRQQFWRKGDTSGHAQTLVSLWVDCDEDTLLARVQQVGAACHTGEKSCFFSRMDG